MDLQIPDKKLLEFTIINIIQSGEKDLPYSVDYIISESGQVFGIKSEKIDIIVGFDNIRSVQFVYKR